MGGTAPPDMRRTRSSAARPRWSRMRAPFGGSSLVAVAAAVGCTHAQLEPGHSAVIPAQNAKIVARQCSRPSPPAFDEAWEPSAAQVAILEEDLPELAKQRAKGCCLVGGRISDVASSWRQYVGLVVGGKKLIYINGFSTRGLGERWMTEPEIMCDGGESAWGALYDPATRSFSELAFNGPG